MGKLEKAAEFGALMGKATALLKRAEGALPASPPSLYSTFKGFDQKKDEHAERAPLPSPPTGGPTPPTAGFVNPYKAMFNVGGQHLKRIAAGATNPVPGWGPPPPAIDKAIYDRLPPSLRPGYGGRY